LSLNTEHHHDQPELNGLGYETYGCEYPQISFDRAALENFFHDLSSAKMGEVVRAKGIFRLGDKWILMELASGDLSSQSIRPLERSKISIIGNGLNREKINASLHRCVKGAIV
jgi:G3E family GTPase